MDSYEKELIEYIRGMMGAKNLLDIEDFYEEASELLNSFYNIAKEGLNIMDFDVVRICESELLNTIKEMIDTDSKEELDNLYNDTAGLLDSIYDACSVKFDDE